MAPPGDPQTDAQPTIAELVGGPLGMAETAAPGVAYVFAYTVSGSDTDAAAAVAVALALVLTIARLARRESPRHALAGLIGVAFAAFIASRSDRAEDYFLPGLVMNAVSATVFLGSIAVRRPLVAVIVGQLDKDRATGWREDPARRRIFTQATLLWSGLFLVRLAVQVPLWAAGAVVALGVARTAMGIPLTLLCLWLTWLGVRRIPTGTADHLAWRVPLSP